MSCAFIWPAPPIGARLPFFSRTYYREEKDDDPSLPLFLPDFGAVSDRYQHPVHIRGLVGLLHHSWPRPAIGLCRIHWW